MFQDVLKNVVKEHCVMDKMCYMGNTINSQMGPFVTAILNMGVCSTQTESDE